MHWPLENQHLHCHKVFEDHRVSDQRTLQGYYHQNEHSWKLQTFVGLSFEVIQLRSTTDLAERIW